MLNVDTITNGLVIDHIRAGYGIRIFNWLGLDKADFQVALVVNAQSAHMGRKDIIKIDNEISVDFHVLGLIDPNITVNVVENQKITEKIKLKMPEHVVDVLTCKNPRCITSTEKYLHHSFRLADEAQRIYRCEYCDEPRQAEDFK